MVSVEVGLVRTEAGGRVIWRSTTIEPIRAGPTRTDFGTFIGCTLCATEASRVASRLGAVFGPAILSGR